MDISSLSQIDAATHWCNGSRSQVRVSSPCSTWYLYHMQTQCVRRVVILRDDVYTQPLPNAQLRRLHRTIGPRSAHLTRPRTAPETRPPVLILARPGRLAHARSTRYSTKYGKVLIIRSTSHRLSSALLTYTRVDAHNFNQASLRDDRVLTKPHEIYVASSYAVRSLYSREAAGGRWVGEGATRRHRTLTPPFLPATASSVSRSAPF